MFNPFKKKDEEEEVSFVKGLSYGLGGALILVVIILAVVFSGSIKDKFSGDDDGSSDPNAAELRFTIIAPENCEDCWNVDLFFEAMAQYNIKELGRETLNVNDKKAQNLIDQYAITQVPTILIAGELDKDPNLAQAWPNLGEVIDGVFIFRRIVPPFIEISSGELRGKFSVIYLDDASCDECYDVALHDNALLNLGMQTDDKRTVDIDSDEGKELIEKYSITAVPTIFLAGDLTVYEGLAQVWPIFGQIADDGVYYFTGMEAMGNYRDLESGQVIEVDLQQPPVQ